MELRHLQYFVAVAEELHFGRAAERLGIAQPGLSRRIRELERRLGVQLFDRNRRAVQLAPAGAALLPTARRVLAQADDFQEIARTYAAGHTGRLRINYTRSVPGGVAAEIVETFRSRHPGVLTELASGYTGLNLEQLRNGATNAAFVRPPIDTGTDLTCQTLTDDPIVVGVPKGHRLARRRRLHASDLRDQPLVYFPRELAPGYWDSILSTVFTEEPWPAIVREEPEEERMLTAVAEDAGITLISAGRAAGLSVAGVVIRHFTEPQPAVPIGLAWRKADSNPALNAFLSLVREHVHAPTMFQQPGAKEGA